MKNCVLDTQKICDDCGECENRCEFDINKVCDNCFRCLDEGVGDYASIEIDGVYLDEGDLHANRPL